MWQFTPVAWLYGAAAAISYTLAIFAWRMRPARGASIASFLMASTGTWALGYLLGFFNTDLSWKLAMLRVEFLGIAGTGYCFFLFALIYSRSERWVNRTTIALLAIVPTISYILILTIGQHDLFYRYYGLMTQGDLIVSEKIYGPAFWVFAAYNYITFFLGVGLLIGTMVRSPVLYRGQIATLVPAALIPLVNNFLYISGINPLTPYDPSSLSFTITGFLVAVSIGSYRFLDIVPVAHDLVMKTIKSGVIVIDNKAQILEMNPAAERMLRCSRDDVLGSAFLKAFPEHRELFLRFQDVTELETEIEVNGATYELQITPLQDHRRVRSGRVIMLHDITRRKEIETSLWSAHNQMFALRRMEAELSRKLSVSYVVLLGMDAAIRLSLANAAFVALSEGNEMRVVRTYGRYPEEFPNSTLSPDEGVVGRVIRQQRAELLLDVSTDPDYKAIIPDTCSQIIIPLMAQDRFIGVLSLETSKPDRFSAYLFEILMLLAGRIAVSIYNARAYEERERLVNDLDAYARTVAHGLKNPLAATISLTEVINRVGGAKLDEHVKRCVASMAQNSRRMNDIIDGLLLLASVRQIEEVEVGRLDMADIVSKARGRLSRMITEFKAEIVVPEKWPEARGYASWVEEIWANLISNAIKYGGAPPRVELGADKRPDDTVRFWVRDNGAGLSSEDLAQLFVPFSRLDPDRAEGHGLGLSIVQRIVERLGGEAGAESEVGKGSVFFFTLPGAHA